MRFTLVLATLAMSIVALAQTAPPIFTKKFLTNPVVTGGVTQLEFSITNSNSATVTGVQFTDPLPPGLTKASSPSSNGGCIGGIDSSTSTTLNINSLSVAPNSVCTLIFDINVAGPSGGLVNITSPITSGNAPTGAPATDTLAVLAPGATPVTLANPSVFSDAYQVGYAANLNIGDSVVNLTNAGYYGGFFGAGTTGNICVNTYVFDPQEEEIGCCACLVTPNGVNSLSVKADLISNNLTPAVPTSVVIKLVATSPALMGGASTVCNPSIAGASVSPLVATVNTLAPGLTAWGSTLEPSATPGTYGPVNVPFLNKALSGSELSALTTVCNFIQANGTGFGICKSCHLGALGGAKQ